MTQKNKKHSSTESVASAPKEETHPNQDAETLEETRDEAREFEQDAVAILQTQLDEKEALLEKANKGLAELKNDYLRLQAETENFKKRLAKEKQDSVQYANQRLLKEIISIHDNLERAMNAENVTIDTLREGVEMILKQFEVIFEKENVTVIESMGQKFDPSIHEVLSQVESEHHEEDTITHEFSRGYYLNGRMLRPAKVVIAKPPGPKNQK
ncbi:MAG: nucleotide exchange factor GrpE [Nitrospinae bacterium CG11_big_fil_rev_8_21_14_0_20_56_8]|nr:MAG: nucleotide exchange factor GrpE [Nitrospinae bacterium CG11_big_fil_rev_8_21_14_0_20_56_8]